MWLSLELIKINAYSGKILYYKKTNLKISAQQLKKNLEKIEKGFDSYAQIWSLHCMFTGGQSFTIFHFITRS